MFHQLLFFPFFPGIFGWTFLALFLVPYFLPTIIAIMRGRNHVGGIFVLNFFLGWTLIGWIASLVWALSSDERTTVIVNNPAPPYNTYHSGYSSDPDYPGSSGYPAQQTNPTIRPASGASSTATSDKYDQLRRLKQLYDEGVLTEEEFNRQKAAILG